MSIFSFITDRREKTVATTTRPPANEALIAELYFQAKRDLRLLFIYKQIERAAETGDWTLLNKLYNEFRLAQASLN